MNETGVRIVGGGVPGRSLSEGQAGGPVSRCRAVGPTNTSVQSLFNVVFNAHATFATCLSLLSQPRGPLAWIGPVQSALFGFHQPAQQGGALVSACSLLFPCCCWVV